MNLLEVGIPTVPLEDGCISEYRDSPRYRSRQIHQSGRSRNERRSHYGSSIQKDDSVDAPTVHDLAKWVHL